ncbi:MAG: ATP-dependent Lon protease, partial [bacterium]
MSLERFTEGKRKYPMLPMRDIVVFPHMTTPFFIGRKQSIEALEDALASDRKIFVVAQKDPMIENPDEGDLYRIGTIGSVLQIMRLPNGTIKALFEGKERGVIVSTEMSGSSYSSVVEALPTENLEDPELLPLVNTVRTEFKTYLKKGSKNIEKPEAFSDPNQSAGKLSDLIAPLLSINLEKK